ncbi:transposase [Cytobacillus sp. S13-E01]|uniref:IS4 family transposase n=1 Tax=Cytobacillus sp. S13-E01 TaxID=3031326 RepID=UPI0023D8BD4A|nr:transposase [Cytobacillus sp. S13-E01]MDF0725764.1 transposase [Cytobacillus sp. S13-E01]MDF0728352.1 transposase [Cytobacillus sp. S13-E01]
MRKRVKEIENVFQSHGFSIDSIIQNVMKKFNFRSLCHQVGFKKEQGYSITDILSLMLLFPLMLIDSVNALYKSNFETMKEMKKDAFYRVKNNSRLPWRNLLFSVSKQFQKLVNPEKEVNPNSAFIFDDTIDARTGKKIEKISYVHDHVAGRKGKSTLGFKNLTMGLFDGTSFTPLDFSLHSEKALKRKDTKKQYRKERNPKTNGAKRIKECDIDKITSALRMLKRAIKHGFKAKYVLVDSWFSSKDFISTVRGIKNGSLHVICAVRRDFRKYGYNGEELNAKEILKVLKKEGKEKRCRKRNVRYFEVVVDYSGIGETVKLYYCRYPYQKDWKLYLSTDESLSLVEMLEIYSIRCLLKFSSRKPSSCFT